MSLLDTLLGRRLASWEPEQAKIGPIRGVPILGLDGLDRLSGLSRSGALVSAALPCTGKFFLSALAILAVIAVVKLHGPRESGVALGIPSILFVGVP